MHVVLTGHSLLGICDLFRYFFLVLIVFLCTTSGKLAMDDAGSDNESGHHGGSSHRGFKSQLDKALTARQEAEAKVTTLEEKIKQYEADSVGPKQKVVICSNIGDV